MNIILYAPLFLHSLKTLEQRECLGSWACKPICQKDNHRTLLRSKGVSGQWCRASVRFEHASQLPESWLKPDARPPTTNSNSVCLRIYISNKLSSNADVHVGRSYFENCFEGLFLPCKLPLKPHPGITLSSKDEL